MASVEYDEDDETSLEDVEETISVCSSVTSEETLDWAVPSRRSRLSHHRGLTRSDGSEALSGQGPSSPRTITARHALLMSPRSRELKRRLPVNSAATPPRLPSVTLVSEVSADELADQAPSCPRREKSRDGDPLPAMDFKKLTTASGSPRLFSSSRERRETFADRSVFISRG